jgi:hypothetical protein
MGRWRLAAAVLVGAVLTGGACAGEDEDAASTTSTTASGPATTVTACQSATPSDPRVDQYVVTVRPPGFEPRGSIERTSTGPADLGGETTATLELVDGAGRSIEVVAFGVDRPSELVRRAHRGAVPEVVELQRCVSSGDPYPALWRVEASSTSERSVVGSQEWEYGGFLVVGGPGVTRAELLAVAAGLQLD